MLEWTPVQAHSTAHRVTLLYACEAATSAAFIKDWDSWREAGVSNKLRTPTASKRERESVIDEALLVHQRSKHGLSLYCRWSCIHCTQSSGGQATARPTHLASCRQAKACYYHCIFIKALADCMVSLHDRQQNKTDCSYLHSHLHVRQSMQALKDDHPPVVPIGMLDPYWGFQMAG